MYFNKIDTGYKIDWKQIYEKAKEFTNNPANTEKIKISRELSKQGKTADEVLLKLKK